MNGSTSLEAEVDMLAMQALRLLPDEPERAMKTWRRAHERAAAVEMPRPLHRLEIVRLTHQARFGDRTSVLDAAKDAQAVAAYRGWLVEESLARLLALFVTTLGSSHEEGLVAAQDAQAAAQVVLEAEELAWLDLMQGHFLGYVAGWADAQTLAYDCLRKLSGSLRTPAGLLANAKKNIGYSHLLVQNFDLARAHLEDAWRLYEPLPPSPRRLSAAKALAQCLLALQEPRAADSILGVALASAQGGSVLYAASALMAHAEVKIALGDLAAARVALAAGRELADEEAEPSITMHAAYVEALCLDLEGHREDAAAVALSACESMSSHFHEVAAQTILQFGAAMQAGIGEYARAYRLQARLTDMRGEAALRAAQIRAIDRDAVMIRLDHVSASGVAQARPALGASLQTRATNLEERLTPREVDVLEWCAHGKSNWSIGQILGMTENTVKFHLKNMSRKLDASAKHQVVAEARRRGLL